MSDAVLTCLVVCPEDSQTPDLLPVSLPAALWWLLTSLLDGGIFRGLKVKNAQDQGMIACIIYTDPAADGNVTVENGYLEYPDGGARNPSQVQRGSVGSMIVLGLSDDAHDFPRSNSSPPTPVIHRLPATHRERTQLARTRRMCSQGFHPYQSQRKMPCLCSQLSKVTVSPVLRSTVPGTLVPSKVLRTALGRRLASHSTCKT